MRVYNKCNLIFLIIFYFLIIQGKILPSDKICYLSFDNIVRTPLKIRIIAEGPNGPIGEISMSDSVKLVKGIKGFGVYLDDPFQFLSLPDIPLNPEEGSISFWFRPFWLPEDKDERQKIIFFVSFEKGLFFLWNLLFCVCDKNNKWSYPPAKTIPDISNWKMGDWHYIVVNWSKNKGKRQIFIDTIEGEAIDYTSPEGKPKIFLSMPPTDISNRLPGCGIIDEFTIYNKALSKEEILENYKEGLKNLENFTANPILEISLYPNSAKCDSITFYPPPNYENKGWTCNGPEDKDDICDNLWGSAFFGSKNSIGWMNCSIITIDFDLGELKHIDTIGLNIGGGSAGVRFPNEVSIYTGTTPENFNKAGTIILNEPYPNPEHPRWYNRLIGLEGLNKFCRFVKLEIKTSGSLFLDEVFIIEKNAQPIFVPVDISKIKRVSDN